MDWATSPSEERWREVARHMNAPYESDGVLVLVCARKRGSMGVFTLYQFGKLIILELVCIFTECTAFFSRNYSNMFSLVLYCIVTLGLFCIIMYSLLPKNSGVDSF